MKDKIVKIILTIIFFGLIEVIGIKFTYEVYEILPYKSPEQLLKNLWLSIIIFLFLQKVNVK